MQCYCRKPQAGAKGECSCSGLGAVRQAYPSRETHKVSSPGNQQLHQSSDATDIICPAELISRLLTWRRDRLCRRLFALLTSGNESAGRCCFTRRLARQRRLICTQLLGPSGAGRCLSAGAFRSNNYPHEPILIEQHGLVGCFTLCKYTGMAMVCSVCGCSCMQVHFVLSGEM